jgi:hypothetical protein
MEAAGPTSRDIPQSAMAAAYIAVVFTAVAFIAVAFIVVGRTIAAACTIAVGRIIAAACIVGERFLLMPLANPYPRRAKQATAEHPSRRASWGRTFQSGKKSTVADKSDARDLLCGRSRCSGLPGFRHVEIGGTPSPAR